MNAGRSSPASAGTRDPKSIAVLGGGITGLTAAFRLSAQGHRVRLFEQGPRLGGVIRTERTDGWLIESGPNSFQPNTREAAALLAELGLSESTIQASPAARNRYIVRRGKLEALPSTPGKLWGSSLFSTKAKLRILTEFALLPRRRGADVSVAAFLRSHFGPEVLEYAGQPFASGIYAGDSHRATLIIDPQTGDLLQDNSGSGSVTVWLDRAAVDSEHGPARRRKATSAANQFCAARAHDLPRCRRRIGPDHQPQRGRQFSGVLMRLRCPV